MSSNIPKKIGENQYEIDADSNLGMKVPVRIYANETLLQKMLSDRTIMQARNVASIPGIVSHSVVLPDGHEGYGFPVGGVAAMDADEGMISPGGVGYDINCGVRLLRTNLTEEQVRPKLSELVNDLFKSIPSGVGSKGAVRLTQSELDEVLVKGVSWAIDNGYGTTDDANVCEENGQIANADPNKVSDKARKRGLPQLGSLGSGNHFLEVQRVEEIHDEEAAKRMGIEEGTITVLIHCGSRGFGHQVCSDYLRISEQVQEKYDINLADRELACVPNTSEEGESYRKAMFAALNFAWSNRQMITHWTRKSFERVFSQSESDLDMKLVYDVAHNIAKVEKHKINGEQKNLVVHRKGATRAFPANMDDVPSKYRDLGQPVLVPGSMGTGSWILLGSENSMSASFGSTAHGAGRMMSRSKARRDFTESEVKKSLNDKALDRFIKNIDSMDNLKLFEKLSRIAKNSYRFADAEVIADKWINLSDESYLAYMYGLSASIDNNNLNKAKEYFDGFKRVANPEDKSDYAKLIFFIIENKNRINVVNFFEEYFSNHENQELHVNFIELLYSYNLYEKVIGHINKIGTFNDRSLTRIYANSQASMNNYSESINILENYISSKISSDRQVELELLELYLSNKSINFTEKYIDSLLVKDPDNPDTLLRIASLLHEKEFYALSEKYLSYLVIENDRINILRGLNDYMLGNYIESIEHFERVNDFNYKIMSYVNIASSLNKFYDFEIWRLFTPFVMFSVTENMVSRILELVILYLIGAHFEHLLGRKNYINLFIVICIGQMIGGVLIPHGYGLGYFSGVVSGVFVSYGLILGPQKMTLRLYFLIPVTLTGYMLIAFIIGLMVIFALANLYPWELTVPLLTGCFAAYIFTTQYQKGHPIDLLGWFQKKAKPKQRNAPPRKSGPKNSNQAKFSIVEDEEDIDDVDAFIQDKIDPILEKIATSGMSSLTSKEKKLLEDAKKRMGK